MPYVELPYRKPITISHANVSSSLSDFPLCVKITADTDIGAVCQSSGNDIRFTDASGNLLYAEKEVFSVTSGSATGVFWVRVPTISSTTDTTIYCYYGSSSLAFSDAVNPWDSYFTAVYHLGDSTTLSVRDSTDRGNSGIVTGSPSAVSGKINGAVSFIGSSSQYIAVNRSVQDDFTISFWLKTSTSFPTGTNYNGTCLVSSAVGGFTQDFCVCGKQNGSGVNHLELICGGPSDSFVDGTVSVVDGTWKHCVITREKSTGACKIYVNGVLDIATTVSNKYTLGANTKIYLGYSVDTTALTGCLDEVRFASTVRSAAWVAFEYDNQTSDSGQLTFGGQENGGAVASSYYKTIAISHTNVSADLTDFPLCFHLVNDADVGAVCQSSGADIRFFNSAGNMLPYEKEAFSVSSGTASGTFWVKVPTVSSTADTIVYLVYGNSSTVAPANNGDVWDANFKGVYHFGDGTTLSVADSTLLANTGTNTSVTAAGGKIGGSGYFNGSTAKIAIPATALPAAGSSFTISTWIKAPSTSTSRNIIDNTTNAVLWTYWPTNGTTNAFCLMKQNIHQFASSTIGFPIDEWAHVAITWNGSTCVYYVNGVTAGGETYALTFTNMIEYIGGNNSTYKMLGYLDEFRLSKSVRSAAWLAFEYLNQVEVNGQLSISGQSTTSVVYTLDVSSSVVCGTEVGGAPVKRDVGSTITLSDTARSTTIIRSVSSDVAVAGVSEAQHYWKFYRYKKSITVSHTNVGSDLTDFPLCVQLSEDSDTGSVCKESGDDIRFADASGNLLYAEKESFSITDGRSTGVFWVRVPTVSSTADTVITMYYGNVGAAPLASTSQAWDEDYTCVLHCADTPLSNSVPATEFSNQLNATLQSVVGKGVVLDGSKYDATTTTLGYQGEQTLELWWTPNGAQPAIDGATLLEGSNSAQIIGSFAGGADSGYSWESPQFLSNKSATATSNASPAWHCRQLYMDGATPSYTPFALEFGPCSNLTPNQLVVVLTPTEVRAYQNGQLVDSETIPERVYEEAVASITVGTVGSNYSGAVGVVDEFRMSRTARSAAWIAFEYYNQIAVNGQLTFGAAQTAQSTAESDFTVVSEATYVLSKEYRLSSSVGLTGEPGYIGPKTVTAVTEVTVASEVHQPSTIVVGAGNSIALQNSGRSSLHTEEVQSGFGVDHVVDKTPIKYRSASNGVGIGDEVQVDGPIKAVVTSVTLSNEVNSRVKEFSVTSPVTLSQEATQTRPVISVEAESELQSAYITIDPTTHEPTITYTGLDSSVEYELVRSTRTVITLNVTSSIEVGSTVGRNVVFNRSVALDFTALQSASFPSTFVDAIYRYCPTTCDGKAATPPATLSGGTISNFFLQYPATGDAIDTLELRPPNLGNKDRLGFNRISRETRGGTLIVFADPMWPKTQPWR
jgi:hypothetical protein